MNFQNALLWIMPIHTPYREYGRADCIKSYLYKNGWEVDPTKLGELYGFYYEGRLWFAEFWRGRHDIYLTKRTAKKRHPYMFQEHFNEWRLGVWGIVGARFGGWQPDYDVLRSLIGH